MRTAGSRWTRSSSTPEERISLCSYPPSPPAGRSPSSAPPGRGSKANTRRRSSTTGAEEGERPAGGEGGYEQREILPAGVLEDLVHRLPAVRIEDGPPERFGPALPLRVRHSRGDHAEHFFRDRTAVHEGVGHSPRDQIPRQLRVGADEED